jgi:Domain of unknown function (DUF4271)
MKRMILLFLMTLNGFNFSTKAQIVAEDSTVSFDSVITDVVVDQHEPLVIADTAVIAQSDTPLPELRKDEKHWWIFLFAVLLLITIGILKNLNPYRHSLSLKSYLITPKAENEVLEDNYGIDFFQTTQILLSCLIFGWLLFEFQPFVINFPKGADFVIFLLSILAVIMLFALKYFGHYIIGLILQTDHLSKLMVYSQSNMIYGLAIIIFPCMMIHYYVPDNVVKYWMEVLLLVILALHVVFMVVKTFRIYFEFFAYRRVYIFIYLCTLEILPLLVLLDLTDMGNSF